MWDIFKISGPRIVVFEVGGVIDIGIDEPSISKPYLTIVEMVKTGIKIIKKRTPLEKGRGKILYKKINIKTGLIKKEN
jgi:hypothetical protein